MYVAKLMVSYLVKLYLFKITLRLYQNHTPIFTTSLADFHRITLRLCQNHTPTLPKSHSDFHKPLADFHNVTGWFSQNHTPTLPKSHSDFTKIADWFSQNHWLISQKQGLILKPQMLFYCTPFQNRTLPHCASCLSEGFSSFVTCLSGRPHCFCPFLWKKPSVVYR